MLPKNKTLPREFIKHTNSTKANKRTNDSKLINAITVTKQKHTIHSRLESNLEYGITCRVLD